MSPLERLGGNLPGNGKTTRMMREAIAFVKPTGLPVCVVVHAENFANILRKSFMTDAPEYLVEGLKICTAHDVARGALTGIRWGAIFVDHHCALYPDEWEEIARRKAK